MVFDGRAFARKVEEGLPKVNAKLVSIYDARNLGAVKYTDIKAKKAKELGVEFEKIQKSNYTNSQIKFKIQNLNKDPGVSGIIIQLPFPNSQELINLIDPEKDVDGLREDSPFKPAVVRAVLTILNSQFSNPSNIIIVGAEGFVGRKLVKVLGAEGMDKEDFDSEKLKSADIIVSCTGQAGLIKPEMVKDGVVAIDVGYPKGDFDPEVAEKASFFTPVPGGVGPVTVVMLFKNLMDAVKSKI